MTFLTPIALIAALLAIPILLLYMLRLRRRDVVVSSHFLWQQVLLDTEANTPWQRLRRNLLLFLQLMILAFLVLALVRPAQVIETISAGRTVLLIDASASMSATDVNGQTRFEAARAQARQIIDNLGPQDELMLIRVADVTEPVTPYSTDASQLRSALDAMTPGQGAGDWSTALTLAAAGAAGAEQFNILILSDGNIPDVGELPENVPAPQFIPIGSSGENWAVSALAARALPDQPTQLYAQVQNDSDQAANVSLVIRLDGELWESSSADVSANSQRAFIFQIDQPFQTVEAQLVLPEGVTDYLALDNTAYATAGEQSTRRVLLIGETPNLFLEQVLRSLPGVQTFRGDAARGIPQQDYDLYILDGWLPTELPDADLLIINPPDSTDLFTVDAARELPATPITTNSADPLLRYVDFETVNIRSFKPITAEWAEPLAQTDAGGLLWAGETGGREIVIVPFDLRDSDWPLQISFPIFMSNAMNAFTPASIIVGESNLQVGETLKIRPPVDTDSMTIMHPDETEEPVTLAGEVAYGHTSQPGLYTLNVTAGDETQEQAFAVNLFGTGESRIAPQTALNLGGQAASDSGEAQFTLREFWPLAALVALIVLLVEWAVYHRRLRAPTRSTITPRSTARI
jgi:Ca-activated chloride channel homolog